MFGKLSTSERVSKVKIQLQDEHPFWAYLILKLEMVEDTKNLLPKHAGLGVNAKGRVLWKKSFVSKLTDPELKFVLAHEVGHLVFSHLIRVGNRDPMVWNVVTDAVLNEILRENGFTPPKELIIPDYRHEIKLFGKTIEHTDEKTAEQLYDELGIPSKKHKVPKGFDKHEFGKNMSESAKRECEERWKDNLVEATIHSKQRGKSPRGMGRLIGDILNPKLSWRQLLRRYITNTLPFDYSFSKPNRKFQDIIMPGAIKEVVEVVAHIDTSGSIGKKELSEFMSEVNGVAGSHQNLKMTLIECDCEIQQVVELTSGNRSKLKKFKVKGGGGTSHKPVFDYINKNIPTCKLLISLTDGYSDIEESNKPRYDVIWVVPEYSAKNDSFRYGKVLRL